MSKLYKFFRLSAATVLILTLASCGGGAGPELPKAIASKADEIPADARAVAAIIEERLRGQTASEVKGVQIPDSLGHSLTDTEFTYDGFGLLSHKLMRYNKRDGKTDGRAVAGRLLFGDGIGRRTEVLYYAEYVFDDGNIRITDVKAATLYESFPKAMVFVVPTQKIKSAGGLPKTHTGILNFVSSNAVNWQTADQVQNKVEDYIIFAFLMDRVSASAEMELKISDDEFTELGYKDSSKYVDIKGWRIGFLPGKFNLATSSLFAKVAYSPGKEAGFGSRFSRMVGMFPLDLKRAKKESSRPRT
ncbi:MAG: hypothetical protein ISR51_09835 [Rhodospirillales bacterium]|nr:hypothetical protein [Alphaproteobacteria bacterium]MBL6948961.1 hypothetical protein [Rhodospirillales bacterium]